MLLLELLKALLFGFVEGVTEWLPVSSTGHLILLEGWVSFKQGTEAFMDLFNVVIQLGAILAVVVIYWDQLNPFKAGKTAQEVRLTWQLWLKVVVAILPVMVCGLFLDDWFDAHFHQFVPVGVMLILYGLIFIWLEHRQLQQEPQVTALRRLSYKTALLIGLFQLLSLMPGTSRSGATIIGGMLLGVSRQVVTEFTFFLGVPVMFGASFLKLVKFFWSGSVLSFQQVMILLVAMLTAFVVSLFAIRFLTGFVKRHDFKVFGYYRIGLGLLILLYAGIQSYF